jgi:GTP-binding protein Era
LIFIDTPGVHIARSTLNVRIVDVALSALGDVDIVMFVIDIIRPDIDSEKMLVKALEKQRCPAILTLNKIDLMDKNVLLKAIDAWKRVYSFHTIVPVSAKYGTRIDELLQVMECALPEGPPYFPQETLTDIPERFLAAEMIREKAIRLTGQEIPYAVAVTVDQFSEDGVRNLVNLYATIHVERDSQKGIIIGKRGRKLKQIGETARKDIERLLGTHVFLKLFVRVQKNWRKDTKALKKFGY